jgi:hypothetical protein
MMPIDIITILEWAALLAAALWSVGLWGIVAGSRKARRLFRGKGYLRPPTGKAWLRFLYYKHYDSFEDPGIRFCYGLAHTCLFIFVILFVALAIFLGSEFLLSRVSNGPTIQTN